MTPIPGRGTNAPAEHIGDQCIDTQFADLGADGVDVASEPDLVERAAPKDRLAAVLVLNRI